MLVYPAYGLLVWHVALGGLQSERSIVYPAMAALGVSIVFGLHLVVGLRERSRDQGKSCSKGNVGSQWIDVGSVDEIPDSRAKVVCLNGRERIAVFRFAGMISAVTNVCAHQRGPLGEGRIVNGCITCPWHGWEYRPDTGVSPPPFNERIATYRVQASAGRIFVDPSPLPPGTPVEPARIEEFSHAQ
jgi:methionine sulfoxide reductase heme-binding subunit